VGVRHDAALPDDGRQDVAAEVDGHRELMGKQVEQHLGGV
jgi:hypothetical protein